MWVTLTVLISWTIKHILLQIWLCLLESYVLPDDPTLEFDLNKLASLLRSCSAAMLLSGLSSTSTDSNDGYSNTSVFSLKLMFNWNKTKLIFDSWLHFISVTTFSQFPVEWKILFDEILNFSFQQQMVNQYNIRK